MKNEYVFTRCRRCKAPATLMLHITVTFVCVCKGRELIIIWSQRDLKTSLGCRSKMPHGHTCRSHHQAELPTLPLHLPRFVTLRTPSCSLVAFRSVAAPLEAEVCYGLLPSLLSHVLLGHLLLLSWRTLPGFCASDLGPLLSHWLAQQLHHEFSGKLSIMMSELHMCRWLESLIINSPQPLCLLRSLRLLPRIAGCDGLWLTLVTRRRLSSSSEMCL